VKQVDLIFFCHLSRRDHDGHIHLINTTNDKEVFKFMFVLCRVACLLTSNDLQFRFRRALGHGTVELLKSSSSTNIKSVAKLIIHLDKIVCDRRDIFVVLYKRVTRC